MTVPGLLFLIGPTTTPTLVIGLYDQMSNNNAHTEPLGHIE